MVLFDIFIWLFFELLIELLQQQLGEYTDLTVCTALLNNKIFLSLSDGYMPLSVQGKTITVPSVHLYDKLTASLLEQLVSDSLS